MNRLSARFELCGLAVALAALGPACNPKSNVAPGAPVLIEMKIIEGGGASVTTIPASTPECPATALGVDGGINGGMCDPTVPLCRLSSASNWCRCVANAAPAAPGPNCVDGGLVDAGTPDAGAPAADAAAPLGGTYDCSPFSPNSAALFVFDRLLDSALLAPGDSGALTTVATTTTTPMPAGLSFTTDYNSNGSPNEIIFPLLGDNLNDGPGLLFAGSPELPGDAVVSITLDPTKVRAKDGVTPFAAGSPVVNGSLAYTTAPFSNSVSSEPTPPALPADAGVCTPAPMTVAPDMTPVVITFNEAIDPTVLEAHVVAKSMGNAAGSTLVTVPVTATTKDNMNVTITPVANWPADSAISVSFDGTTPNLVGDKLGTNGAAATFTTSAM